MSLNEYVPRLRPRLPKASGMGADPIAAARATGLGDRPDEEARAHDAQARQEDQSLEDDMRKAATEAERRLLEYHQREADVMNVVARARDHDKRTIFSPHDAQIARQMRDLLHSVVGVAPPELDSVFAPAAARAVRPLNAGVDRAIRKKDKPSEEVRGSSLIQSATSSDNDADDLKAFMVSNGLDAKSNKDVRTAIAMIEDRQAMLESGELKSDESYRRQLLSRFRGDDFELFHELHNASSLRLDAIGNSIGARRPMASASDADKAAEIPAAAPEAQAADAADEAP